MRVGVAQNRSLEFTKSFFRPFTFTVDTTLAGGTTSVQYQLPLSAATNPDLVVDWGDGSEDEITVWNQAETLHTYSVGGVKTIKITGTQIYWGYFGATDTNKLISIDSWGDVLFTYIEYSLSYNNASVPLKAPIFRDNAVMTGTFRNMNLLNQNINNWDVSKVTFLNGTFRSMAIYNQPLNNWDVSKVTFMSACFRQAIAFNQPLDNWDTSKVTTMNQLFYQATAFNQDLGAWNVALVTDMTNMLTSTAMTQANYDALLIGWTGWSGGVATKSVQSSVPFSIGTVKYTLGGDAQAAHDWLTGTKLWTITDGGGI